ncbi:Hsp20/alpha crystallin family protein [Aridibaculum aurantiacum]|uniref:Hsp20/alpha crystallin family protein n=1 Tax=Aridibaculum aurantiacum TaxID=2810307 RepID=UPI001A95F4DB|nr:Hsp20/alpha crystallin family protein [Aridibaculum aurantiacum]
MYTTRNYTPGKTLSTVFDELFNAFPATPQKAWPAAVPVNIHEDEKGYHLELQAPGRSKDAFEIKLDEKILTISSEVIQEEQTAYKTIRREFSSKSFKRSFTLDETINADGIEAKYEDGILKVYLPKREEVKNSPKQITIS